MFSLVTKVSKDRTSQFCSSKLLSSVSRRDPFFFYFFGEEGKILATILLNLLKGSVEFEEEIRFLRRVCRLYIRERKKGSRGSFFGHLLTYRTESIEYRPKKDRISVVEEGMSRFIKQRFIKYH